MDLEGQRVLKIESWTLYGAGCLVFFARVYEHAALLTIGSERMRRRRQQDTGLDGTRGGTQWDKVNDQDSNGVMQGDLTTDQTLAVSEGGSQIEFVLEDYRTHYHETVVSSNRNESGESSHEDVVGRISGSLLAPSDKILVVRTIDVSSSDRK